MMNLSRFSQCALLLSSLAGSAVARGDERLAQRFAEQAPAKWMEHEGLAIGIEYDVARVISWDDGTTQETQLQNILGREAGLAIYEYEMNGAEYNNRGVYGANGDYCFELVSPGMASDLIINDVRMHRQNAKDAPAALLRARHWASQIRFVGSVDLLDIVSSPHFRVTEAREVSEEDELLVEVKFEYTPDNPGTREKTMGIYRSGSILFRPGDFWAIARGTVSVEDPSRFVAAIRFEKQIETDAGGVPLVANAHDVATSPTGALVYDCRMECSWKPFTGTDDTFTLSAYGFPEPGFEDRSMTRVWLVLSSLVLLFLLLAFSLQAKKRQAKC